MIADKDYSNITIKHKDTTLDVIQGAIREIGYSERLEDIPDDNE